MKQELLPCPFCGITPKTLATHDDGCHVLCCGDCDVNPSCSHETMEAAVKAWNTRAPDARVQLLIKALREAREELSRCVFIMNGVPSQQVLMEKLDWSEEHCKSFVQARETGEACVYKIDAALKEAMEG